MGLLLVEVPLEKPEKDRAEGRPDEEAAVKVFDVVEVAEAEVATGWELLQGVVLLSYLPSDPSASS